MGWVWGRGSGKLVSPSFLEEQEEEEARRGNPHTVPLTVTGSIPSQGKRQPTSSPPSIAPGGTGALERRWSPCLPLAPSTSFG